MAITAFLLGCLLASTVALPLEPSQNNKDTRIVFGDGETLRTTSRNIWHMEHDLYGEPGAILFAFGSALKTTRGDDVFDVVGSIDTYGYKEGQGKEAIFHVIQNFVQLSREKVIIVDRYTSCLRELNRTSGQTSPYAGKCGSRGYADGDAVTAQFNLPNDIIMDERTKQDLIIVDLVNHALRSVNMASKVTKTILKDSEKLTRPRAAIFDKNNNDVLYVTVKFQILKLKLSDLSTELLSGSTQPQKYLDGSFDSALLSYFIADIVQLDDSHLAVTDYWNHDVRILDLVNKKVTSLCESEYNGTSVAELGCTLRYPHSLLLFNNSLYVGHNAQIHKFPVTSIPADQTIEPSGFDSVCRERNITATINAGEEKAKVEIYEDLVVELSAGEYRFVHTERGASCLTNVLVKGNLGSCPSSIDRVASPDTKTAAIDLAFGGTHHQLELPIGRYPYSVKTAGIMCNFVINVFDSDMERRLQFEVKYKFDCDDINSNNASTNILSSTIKHNYVYILEVCGQECRQQPEGSPAMTCKANTLTVLYPTDVIYGGDVRNVPREIQKVLTDRLVKKGTIMSVVDVTSIPPVTFPIKQADGASAKVVLTSSCLNQKLYDAATDSCL